MELLTTMTLIAFAINKGWNSIGEDAGQLILAGNQLSDKKEYQESISYYTRAIQINPKIAKAYYNRANSYIKIQEFAKAISDFTKAIEIEPHKPDCYYNRGIIYYQVEENYNKAISDFSKTISLDAQYINAYLFRADSKFYIDENIGAIADYTKYLNHNPQDPENSETLVFRGIAKAKLEDYRGAITDFKKAIEINPSNGNAYYNRGLSKIRLGQKESGCMDLSKAGELGIEDAYVAIKAECN